MIADAARQIINRLVILAVCLTPLFYLPGFALINTLNDGKWFLLHCLGPLLVAAWGVYLLAGGAASPGIGRPGPAHMALLAYGGLMIVSALLSGQAAYSLTACITPVYFLVISFTPLMLNWTEREIAHLLRYAFIAGALVAASAMWQTLDSASFFKIIPYDLPFHEARISVLGTLGNPEYLGTYLAPLLLIAAPWLMRGPAARRALTAAAAGMMALVLLLTTARGAALGFAAGGMVSLLMMSRAGWWRLGRRAWAAIGAGAAAALALAVMFSFPNPVNTKGWEILPRFAKIADLQSESIYERIIFYSIGAEIVSQDPVFGAGEGMFAVRFYPTLASMSARDPGVAIDLALDYMDNRVASKAHNDYLEVWAENGTLAFLALLLAMVATVWLGWKSAGNRKIENGKSKDNIKRPSEFQNPKSEILLLSLYPAFLCILLYSLFSFPMQMPSRGPLFWVAWGCLAQVIHLRQNVESKRAVD